MSFLAPLNQNAPDDGMPVYLVAGALGEPLNMWPLAKELADAHPVFGIRARGLGPGETPHSSIEEAAEEFLADIRQSHGLRPMVLGGFCSGGLVALEMARRLQQEGIDCPQVLLLDSSARREDQVLTSGDRWAWHRRKLARSPLSYPFAWLFQKLAGERQDPGRLSPAKARELGASAAAQEVFAATLNAVKNYEPAEYRGSCLLSRPPIAEAMRTEAGLSLDMRRCFVAEDNFLSWFLPQLEIAQVDCQPGDHDHFVDAPFAAEIAGKLLARLQAVVDQGSSVGAGQDFGQRHQN